MGAVVFIFIAILVAGVVLGIFAGLAARALKKRGAAGSAGVAHAYEAAPEFLTAAERSFFGVLRQAIASDYQIFAKARLADIVRPVRNPSRSGWQTAFNRIAGKHVDFVLCDPVGLNVVGIIELDDRSHGTLERGVRDSLVDGALADAKIPVLRVPASRSYAIAQIREQVREVFGGKNAEAVD